MNCHYMVRNCLALPALVAATSGRVLGQGHADATAAAVTITVGRSVIPLNGPWFFRTGDDPRWADPSFDASAWETVDFTPNNGAHDPDVGLVGYVPGWGARGYPAYSGYAWYRLNVIVDVPPGTTLAIAGPLEVNDAYQLFVNGQLLGGSGRFGRSPPVAYNTRPELFVVGDSARASPAIAHLPVSLAVRVWMSPATARAAADAGGIRIAPAIGELGAIQSQYRLAWLAKFLGYVVEVVEAAAFALLAVLAWIVSMSDRTRRGYAWLIAALLLVGLLRANQAFFFWTPWESARVFLFLRFVLLTPLALGAWTMACRNWLAPEPRHLVFKVTAALTTLYVLAGMLALMTSEAGTSGQLSAAVQAATTDVRLLFLGVTAHVAYRSAAKRPRVSWLTVLAMLLMTAGLYAQELSYLGVPGIWFPFGVGVSRTQFAFAGFAVVKCAELLRRQFVLTRSGPPPEFLVPVSWSASA